MFLKLAYVSLIALFVSGCTSLGKTYLPEDLVKVDASDNVFIDISEKELLPKVVIDLSKIKEEDYDKNNKKHRAVIAKAITLADKKCALHKAIILSNSAGWNVGTGSASILFSGAASVLEHAKTAADLSALSAATTGIQSLYNKEVFFDYLAPAILKGIDASRERKMATIISKYGVGSVETYNTSSTEKPSTEETHKVQMHVVTFDGATKYKHSIFEAIADIQDYHIRCSLMNGLVELTQALANRKPSSNEIELQIKVLQNQLGKIEGSSDTDVQAIEKRIKQKIADKVLQLSDAL